MSYKIKTDVFEGPFELLVYLIEHARMSIYDIKIAEITDQYLERVMLMQSLHIETAGEFMVLAATLIEIKSRMLLPRYQPAGAADAPEEDPRAELVQRILEYKKYKAASELLLRREEYAQLSLTKPREDLGEYIRTGEESLDLDVDQFIKAFQLFLIKKKKVEEIHKHYGEIKRERFSVEDKMTQIQRIFQARTSLSFEMLIGDWEDRQEVIAAFMAVLELLRRSEIRVRQLISFGGIYIERGERFVQ